MNTTSNETKFLEGGKNNRKRQKHFKIKVRRWVTYRFSDALRQNDAAGWGWRGEGGGVLPLTTFWNSQELFNLKVGVL